MAKRLILAKYWPAALFAVSNIAAVTLVIKANSSYDSPAQAALRTPAPAAKPLQGFEPLDSTDAAKTDGSHTPLLLDWGQEFDIDQAGRGGGGGGLLQGAYDRLADLRRQGSGILTPDEREAKEADLMRRPLHINYYDRAGGFLGRNTVLPPIGYTLPPLSPIAPLTTRVGGQDVSIYGGTNRTIDVQVDPSLFKDPQAMAEFINQISHSMAKSGMQPRVRVIAPASVAGTRPVISTLPTTNRVTGGVLPLPPGGPRLPLILGGTASLPRPPADVVEGVTAPRFERELAPASNSKRGVITEPGDSSGGTPAPRAERPKAAAPKGPGAIELAGSSDAPAHKDVAPAPKPAPKAEPTVHIRIQLAKFPDQKSADRALSRLRGGGLGGHLVQDSSSGLDYWIVYTKTYTKRSEAKKALGEVRSMGYEAWQN